MLGQESNNLSKPEHSTNEPTQIIEPTFVVNDKYLIEFDDDGNLDMIDYIPYYLQYNGKVKAYLDENEKRKQEYEQKKKEFEQSQQK